MANGRQIKLFHSRNRSSSCTSEIRKNIRCRRLCKNISTNRGNCSRCNFILCRTILNLICSNPRRRNGLQQFRIRIANLMHKPRNRTIRNGLPLRCRGTNLCNSRIRRCTSRCALQICPGRKILRIHNVTNGILRRKSMNLLGNCIENRSIKIQDLIGSSFRMNDNVSALIFNFEFTFQITH